MTHNSHLEGAFACVAWLTTLWMEGLNAQCHGKLNGCAPFAAACLQTKQHAPVTCTHGCRPYGHLLIKSSYSRAIKDAVPPLCFKLDIKVMQHMHQACMSDRVFCMQPASLLGAAHVSVACSPDCSCCELPCRLQQRLRPNKQTYAASICRSSWQSSRRAFAPRSRRLKSCSRT